MNFSNVKACPQFSPLKPASYTDAFAEPGTAPEDTIHANAFEETKLIPIFDISGKLVSTIPSTEKPEWQCQACMKGFSTKQSLERHKERYELCKNWETRAKIVEPVPVESVHKWATRTIDEALCILTDFNPRCKFCKKEFSNIGNLHKHFSNATTCNRLAYASVREAFTTTPSAHT